MCVTTHGHRLTGPQINRPAWSDGQAHGRAYGRVTARDDYDRCSARPKTDDHAVLTRIGHRDVRVCNTPNERFSSEHAALSILYACLEPNGIRSGEGRGSRSRNGASTRERRAWCGQRLRRVNIAVHAVAGWTHGAERITPPVAARIHYGGARVIDAVAAVTLDVTVVDPYVRAGEHTNTVVLIVGDFAVPQLHLRCVDDDCCKRGWTGECDATGRTSHNHAVSNDTCGAQS